MAHRMFKQELKSDSVEVERIRELHSYGILDTEREERFEQIVEIVSAYFEVPMVAISFVDEERQWHKAQRGLQSYECRKSVSFCEIAIQNDEILYVPDAANDLRFSRHPFVTGEAGIRFYAGAPLITVKGHRLGTLCVLDRRPRELTVEQRKMLRILASQVMDQIELRRIDKDLMRKNLELSEAHAEIQEMREILIQKSKMASLGEIAGGIGHEINNPLAVIKARAQMIRNMVLRGSENTESLLASVEKIDATIVRVVKIISGLRKFARVGDQDPFVKTSLREIVEDVTELCAVQLKDKEVQFEVKGLDMDPQLECRNVQIMQVLVNLLNNAIDATSSLENKWICLEVTENPGSIEIKVKDSGSGIPLEIRDRIMKPFFTTKGIGKGSGLGLSISKAIIESHHGTFTLDEKSPNTCFRILLPVSQPSK